MMIIIPNRPVWIHEGDTNILGAPAVEIFGLVVTAAYLTTLTIAFSTGNMNIKLLWMLLTLLFVVERVVTVRYRGWKRMAQAATMYELLFDFFLQACHAKAYFGAFFRTA